MGREDVIVSAEWLSARLNTPGYVVLESSIFLEPALENQTAGRFVSGATTFELGPRIPGARFADLFSRFSDTISNLPFTRPTASQFRLDAGALGISETDHVIVYDRLSSQWAARLWWVFTSHGHRKVSVLDGGLNGYDLAGLPLETAEPSEIIPHIYSGSQIGGPPYARRSDVQAVVAGHRDAHLVCFLQPDDYAGRLKPRARSGHIPGSVNLPFNHLLDPITRKMLPLEDLRQRFEAVFPLDGREIITYCGGGIASTVGALALARLGYENTREYDGSLLDWISDPTAPLQHSNA